MLVVPVEASTMSRGDDWEVFDAAAAVAAIHVAVDDAVLVADSADDGVGRMRGRPWILLSCCCW